jgi:hypothetical protein
LLLLLCVAVKGDESVSCFAAFSLSLSLSLSLFLFGYSPV